MFAAALGGVHIAKRVPITGCWFISAAWGRELPDFFVLLRMTGRCMSVGPRF